MIRNLLSIAMMALAVSIFIAGCSGTSAPTAAPPTAAPMNMPAPTNVPAPTNAPAPTDAPVAPNAPAPTTAAAPTNVPSSGGDVATVTLIAVPGKSKANYRVREQLANVSLPGDAVGVTDQLSGQIVGKTDGTIVSADSKFVVDLTTLKSDQGMRDGFIQRETLRTSQYPNATFVPTATSGLPATLPPTGPVTFQLMGDLTIRDVTKNVTWDVNCTPTSATEGTCHASTKFTFDDFGIPQPRVPRVLSIEDTITLEVDVALQVSP
ncbi:YceI family protein [Anaerolineae bacterium CFX7]|nr:YceI family protein [Anaerolineae bacterium CFX7]